MKELGKLILAFLAVFGEMFRQFYLSTVTPSEEFEAIQEAKFQEEASKPILEEEE